MDGKEGHWSWRTILEPKSGAMYNKYFYKRKPASRVVIDTPKAKAYAGYMLIEKDLRSAKIWIEHIINTLSDDPNFKNPSGYIKATYDREKFNLVKGLFVASLTFYGKCFTTCEGRRIKLERSNLDEKYHESHDDAMRFRNNFAAHSGEKKIEQARVVIALDSKRKALPFFSSELKQPDTTDIDGMREFIELIDHAKTYTDQKISTLGEMIYKEDILAKGREYWEKKG